MGRTQPGAPVQPDPDSAVVLVTGGTRGIGRALVEHLRHRGHRLALTGVHPARLEAAARDLGDDVLVQRADASDPEQVQAVVDAVHQRFGRLDALVNNAGIAEAPAMLWKQDPEAWWRVLEVNVRGPMLATRAALPGMLAQHRGAIVNVGSLAAVSDPIPGMSGYPVSKAALQRLTEIVAEEVRDTGVGVYTVSPGLVRTDMTRDVPLFRDLPDDAWAPVDGLGPMVAALIENDCTPLSGRFLHVRDDLDRLLTQADEIEAQRLLRLRMDRG